MQNAEDELGLAEDQAKEAKDVNGAKDIREAREVVKKTSKKFGKEKL